MGISCRKQIEHFAGRPARHVVEFLREAAGTAAVFLAAFLVLPGLLGGGDDADTVAFEQTADELGGGADAEGMATTDAAAEAPRAAVPSDDTAETDFALEETAPAATVTPVETTAATDVTGDGAAPGYLVQGDLTEDLRLEIVDQLRTDADYFESNSAEIVRSAPDWLVCSPAVFGLDYLGLSYRPQLVGLIVDDLGEERLLVALVDNEDVTQVALMSITVPGCEVFETLP
jgi:hypothetical protein